MQHVNLLNAFNKKSDGVKKQAMLEINIDNFGVNQIVLLSLQVLTDAILGLDFLVDYHAVINFSERNITFKVNPLKTKRRPLYLKTQFVPHSKHFSSRL